MSVELVTGYSGVGGDVEPNRHVSSADDGARQAGTVGTGMYVLGTGSKMGATMEDANTLVVADGDAMVNGRHVRIPDTLSFTIPTGVQGQKVANLAVLRYSKAADSVESVTPVVLTGEPDPDSPADPALSEGSVLDGDSPVDMPLYRVVTDGINAGDPEPLFDVMPSMAELRDSVSQVEEKTDLVSFIQKAKSVAINAYAAGFEIESPTAPSTSSATASLSGRSSFPYPSLPGTWASGSTCGAAARSSCGTRGAAGSSTCGGSSRRRRRPTGHARRRSRLA